MYSFFSAHSSKGIPNLRLCRIVQTSAQESFEPGNCMGVAIQESEREFTQEFGETFLPACCKLRHLTASHFL